MHDLVPFVQFKNMENTHGGVLILVKLLNWIEEGDNEDDDMPLVENNGDDDSCSDLYESDIVQSDDEDVK